MERGRERRGQELLFGASQVEGQIRVTGAGGLECEIVEETTRCFFCPFQAIGK